MPKVYVCDPIPENGILLLKRNGFDVDINHSGKDLTREGLKKVVKEYDAVITFLTNKVDEEVIKSASKKLKIISNFTVGFDNLDVEAINAKGIIVCNTPGVASESVAEHTFALILALNKKLFEQDKFVRDGKYTRWDPTLFLSHQVWGQTIGIIGLGRIGMFVGQVASQGFRMKILYFDPKKAEDFELLTGANYLTVEEILKDADVVSLHIPLTEKTRHLIGRKELKMMKKTALLINTARGPIIDEEALIWALAEGEIAGAGLDVYENEPEISTSLLKSTKVVLTPHTASGTFETRLQMSRIAAQNIIDVFSGKDPLGLLRPN